MNQMPLFIEDEVLGRMEYNAELSWYEGWLDDERIGFPAEISLAAMTQQELTERTEFLRSAVRGVEALVALAKDEAQKSFFDSGYVDDSQIDVFTFRERLELLYVWIDDNGLLALSFSTDDMFPGHAIKVVFDSELATATATLW